MASKYEYYKLPVGHKEQDQWRWRLVASNGEPIASGEAYKNKADVLHVIDLLKATDASTKVNEVEPPKGA